MVMSLRAAKGGGGGFEIGECMFLPERDGVIITQDNMTFMASGNTLAGYSSTYPDMYSKFPNFLTRKPTVGMNGVVCNDIAYGSNVYVACFNDGLYVSNDMITWTRCGTPVALVSAQVVAYQTDKFIAAVYKTGNIYTILTSPDGLVWTERDDPSSDIYNTTAMAISPTLSIMVGYYNKCIVSTNNGLTWSTSDRLTTNTANSIAYGNGIFVVASGISTAVVTTTNGGVFTSRTVHAINSLTGEGVTFLNGVFVVEAYDTSTPTTRYRWTSTDGINWISTNAWPAGKKAYYQGKYISVSGTQVSTSTDGVTWNTFPNVCLSVGYVNMLKIINGQLIVGDGQYGQGFLYDTTPSIGLPKRNTDADDMLMYMRIL